MGYIERITIIYTTVLLYEEENPMPVKYVFVTGGVVSGLGKGITAASLGRLLKARGYKVTMQKFVHQHRSRNHEPDPARRGICDR